MYQTLNNVFSILHFAHHLEAGIVKGVGLIFFFALAKFTSKDVGSIIRCAKALYLSIYLTLRRNAHLVCSNSGAFSFCHLRTSLRELVSGLEIWGLLNCLFSTTQPGVDLVKKISMRSSKFQGFVQKTVCCSNGTNIRAHVLCSCFSLALTTYWRFWMESWFLELPSFRHLKLSE